MQSLLKRWYFLTKTLTSLFFKSYLPFEKSVTLHLIFLIILQLIICQVFLRRSKKFQKIYGETNTHLNSLNFIAKEHFKKSIIFFCFNDTVYLNWFCISNIVSPLVVNFKWRQKQPHATNLNNGSIRKPQEVAVEFAESVQMNGVDWDVGGDLLPPLHRLLVFYATLIPNALLHLKQSTCISGFCSWL